MVVEESQGTFLMPQFGFRGKLENVDVVKIVEVLAVKSSENDHAAANKACAMSSARFGLIGDASSHPHTFHSVGFCINDEYIVQITAETTSKDINFAIEDYR